MNENDAVTPVEIVLGIGTGRCGTLSLSQFLSRQPESSVSHELRPLLPWRSTDRTRLVVERLGRFRAINARRVGDVGSFYLPYVEEFIAQAPSIRVLVLRRDCEEVVESFSKWSDIAHSAPADHWSERPSAGLFHDPIWSTIFPKYPTANREDGIRRYWHEYYDRAADLQRRYPDHVRLFDMHDALNSEAGQRELLRFAGVAEEQQVLDTGIHLHQNDAAQEVIAAAASVRAKEDGNNRSKCVILVPNSGQIVSGCEDSLKVLESRGYVVRRVRGYSQIDVARNEIASKAMLDGFAETLWIDADIGFHPDAVERLRSHDAPIVCGVYSKKGKRELAISVLPGTKKLTFGNRGGLHEIQYAATGFLLVRRQVYLDIQFKLDLPLCNESFGANVIPYFMPMTRPHREGNWYLGEDYAFCERVRQAGHKVMADTSIRLWHIGNYQYGWEDAGRNAERFGDYTFHFND